MKRNSIKMKKENNIRCQTFLEKTLKNIKENTKPLNQSLRKRNAKKVLPTFMANPTEEKKFRNLKTPKKKTKNAKKVTFLRDSKSSKNYPDSIKNKRKSLMIKNTHLSCEKINNLKLSLTNKNRNIKPNEENNNNNSKKDKTDKNIDMSKFTITSEDFESIKKITHRIKEIKTEGKEENKTQRNNTSLSLDNENPHLICTPNISLFSSPSKEEAKSEISRSKSKKNNNESKGCIYLKKSATSKSCFILKSRKKPEPIITIPIKLIKNGKVLLVKYKGEKIDKESIDIRYYNHINKIKIIQRNIKLFIKKQREKRITKGLLLFKKTANKKLFDLAKIYFNIYMNRKRFYVKQDQYKLVKALRGLKIRKIQDLKQYLVDLLEKDNKNNKL